MASSISCTPTITQDQHTIRKINDALYELYKPAQGFVDIEVVFFHGFQAQNYEDAYLKGWMLPDDSECWLNIWLSQEFPQARIMSVSYDSSTQVSDSAGRMDMHLVAENLLHSMVGLERIGGRCPVVLVGHCIGGLVLKQVCLEAEQMAAREMGPDINPYKAFLGSMKGTFFYSTPNSGSRITPMSNQRGPLVQYLELFSKDAARVSSSFAKLRQQHGWKTFGVLEANETEDFRSIMRILHPIRRFVGWKPQTTLVVEEGSARYDLDDFCVLSGEDNFTICRPRDRTSNSFLHLVQFMRGIVQIERMVQEHWRITLRLPRFFVDPWERVEQVIDMLQLGVEQQSRLALVGMGGKGKTTLAKAVFIRIRPQFDFVCFVENVKGQLRRHSIENLVADNLYADNGLKVRLQTQSLRLCLGGKKVLLVMDDIDSEEQISTLLPPTIGGGSRVIVTSRTRSSALMPTFRIWEVPFLFKKESYDLFRSHVDTDVIQRIPEGLIDMVVQKCEGLPLTIEVIGSYLRFEENIDVWTSTLEKLTSAVSLDGSKEDRLWAKLRVSYDELAPLERKMFLDLAVFDDSDTILEDVDLEILKAAWETGVHGRSVDSCLRNLVDRSFIDLKLSRTTISSVHTTFWMHEQLRGLGKSISRPSDQKIELCRGVWRLDDIIYLLNEYKGNKPHTEVVSVILDPCTSSQRMYRWSSIAELQELRLLRLSHVCMTRNGSLRFPSKLAFLDLTACCLIDTKRKSDLFHSYCWPIREDDVEQLQQLSVLRLDNCASVHLPRNFHKLRSLKVLIIRRTHLKDLPGKFGFLPALKVLILENVGLSQLPNSFSQSLSLETLTLKGCPVTSRGIVPQLARWGGKDPLPLCKLTKLRLEDLQNLTNLPREFSLLQALEELSVVGCSALKQLPEAFGKLKNLFRLEIVSCSGLESLCESFGELASLWSLRILHCPRLRCLPNSVGHLQLLTCLSLEFLNIVAIPESARNLPKLTYVSIIACEGVLRRNPFPTVLEHTLELLDLGNCAPVTLYTAVRSPAGSMLPLSRKFLRRKLRKFKLGYNFENLKTSGYTLENDLSSLFFLLYRVNLPLEWNPNRK